MLDAGDGHHALRIVDRYPDPIDLLVTDVVLPGSLDGFTLGSEVVWRHPEINVLYMSGHFDHLQPVRQGLREAGRFYLRKPFRREEFRRIVETALDTPIRGADAFAAILSHPEIPAHAITDQPPEGAPARSLRYRVRLPVRYRLTGVSDWEVGVTVDISRTGVLFEVRHPNAPVPAKGPKPAVDLRLELPSRGGSNTEIVCRGQLARSTLPDAEAAPTALAVAVSAYHTDIRQEPA